MVVIRLARGGAKKRPFYHIVATDKRNARDGRNIERLGYFNPVAMGKEIRLHMDMDRVNYWLSQGAQTSDKVANLIKAKRLRTYYYDSLPIIIPGNKKSEELYKSKKKFCYSLGILPQFEVSFGELQYIKGIYKQKKVDVLMSLDIVDKCFGKQISHAVIVAGDSDFIPAIKRAKNYGAIVHLIAHKETVNREMFQEVDVFYNLNEGFIKDCLLEKT